MEKAKVLKNLKVAAAYYGLLARRLDDHTKNVINGLVDVLADLPSAEKVVINLDEFSEAEAINLREMFGPFANIMEMLAAVLDNCSIESNGLVVYNQVPVEELLKELEEYEEKEEKGLGKA